MISINSTDSSINKSFTYCLITNALHCLAFLAIYVCLLVENMSSLNDYSLPVAFVNSN